MTVSLVGVQIDYHDSLYHHSCSEIVNCEGYVGVNAETTACGEASVMETA